MKSRAWTVNIETRRRKRVALFLSSGLLLAIAGYAQKSIDPIDAMAPAQLQRTVMLKAGQIQPARKNSALPTATNFASAKEAPEVHDRSTVKNRKTQSSRSERRKSDD